MTVAQKLRRKMKITNTTSTMVIRSVICTSSTAARIVSVRSLMILILMAGGIVAISRESCALIRFTVSMTFAPGCLLHVLRAGDGMPDVANAQWSAVAVGDDDVIPLAGLEQLVVGVDRV